MAALVHAGAELLLHLGDAGTPAVLDALVVAAPGRPAGEATLPARVVFGNNDDPRELIPYAEAIGLGVDHPVGWLPVEGGELVYLHGDDDAAMQAALNRGVRYLYHGHTHRPRDDRRGATRIINPGALHRAAAYHVALLDTGSDALAFVPVLA